jgi:hypothetical protein
MDQPSGQSYTAKAIDPAVAPIGLRIERAGGRGRQHSTLEGAVFGPNHAKDEPGGSGPRTAGSSDPAERGTKPAALVGSERGLRALVATGERLTVPSGCRQGLRTGPATG